MRNKNPRRKTGFRRSGNSKSKYHKFSKNNKRGPQYTWSEKDLIEVINNANNGSNVISKVERTPVNTFDAFNIDDRIKQNIKNKGFENIMPIQDEGIPVILAGRDLIAMANTGTGKTATFLIPLIDKVSKDRSQKVLIIAPTRDLAEQINEEFIELARGLNIRSQLVIGGKNMFAQIRDLQRKPNFLIGTPGRIRDLINRKSIDLSEFNNVVLDETDRMVDIGFINEIKHFITLLPEKRQSLFFSATISQKVTEILDGFVQNPVRISVKQRDVTENIKQGIVRIEGGKSKVDQLHDLLIQDGYDKVLIFGTTKWSVQKLADELIDRGFSADVIHGNKRQSQRKTVLDKFKNNKIKILLATDVASRGLDLKDVSHVINYELPLSYDEYIHRIGRTGRANKQGIALTFVTVS